MSENSPLGQLILPETLKLLPLYACSIVKNDAVSGGKKVSKKDMQSIVISQDQNWLWTRRRGSSS